jgi:hypothetical protein
MDAELAIKILDKISLITGIIAAVTMVWLVGVWSGFSYGGSHLCEYAYPLFNMNGGTYTMSHADPYEMLTHLAGVLSISVFVFVLIKVFERGRFVRLTAAIALFVAAYFGFKLWDGVSEEIVQPDKYLDIVRESSDIFYIAFALIIFTLLLQITTLIVASVYKKSPDRIQ